MEKNWLHRINVVVTIWGFLSILTVAADFFGILPLYDIYYKKKTDITTELSVYPGGSIQLDALIWDPTKENQIESVSWDIRDSTGKAYPDVPSLKTVRLQLLPDFSGTMTVAVSAKLIDDASLLRGHGSFQIVQSKPFELANLEQGRFFIPSQLDDLRLGRVQIYSGNAIWVDGKITRTGDDVAIIEASDTKFPTWDGQAYLRFVPATWDPSSGALNDPPVEYAVFTNTQGGSSDAEQ